MKIRPLMKKVLVKLDDEKNKKTAGGIYIPEITKEDRQYGIVTAMGVEAFAETKELKVGDKIMMLKYHGDPIEIDGEKYRLMDAETIIAVVEE